MNDRIRKILFGAVILSVLIGVLLIIGHSKNADNGITKYEWIQMLVQKFGITECLSYTPYFENVNPENEYFVSVQSAVEWGILEKNDTFEGSDRADGEFIILTGMKCVGRYKIQIYLEMTEEPTNEDYLNLAVEKGLIKKSQFSKIIAVEECQTVLEGLIELYLGGLWKDDILEIEYQEEVIEIPAKDIVSWKEGFSKITVDKECAEKVFDGDIIVFEISGTGQKVAKKIVEKNYNGELILENSELNDVVNKMFISDVEAVSFKEAFENGYVEKFTPTEYVLENECSAMLLDTKNSVVEAEHDGVEIGIKGEGKTLTLTFTNHQLRASYDTKIELDSSCYIDASATIDTTTVGIQVIKDCNDLQYANIQCETKLGLSGIAEFKEIEKAKKIWSSPIYLAGGIAEVELEIYLVLSIDGGVSLEIGIPSKFAVEYRKSSGVRAYADKFDVLPSIKANCTGEGKFRIQPTVKLLQFCEVLDAKLDAGVELDAEQAVRYNSNVKECTDISAYAPIITIASPATDEKETLLSKMGLKAELTIVDKEMAFAKKMHFEGYTDGSYQFVEECTFGTEDDYDYIIQDIPHQYSAILNSKFVDKGDYYEVSAHILDIVRITEQDISEISIGDKYSYDDLDFLCINKKHRDGWHTDEAGNWRECGEWCEDYIYIFTDTWGKEYIVDTYNYIGYEDVKVYDFCVVTDEGTVPQYIIIDDDYMLRIMKTDSISINTSIEELEKAGKTYNFESFTIEGIVENNMADAQGRYITDAVGLTAQLYKWSDGEFSVGSIFDQEYHTEHLTVAW